VGHTWLDVAALNSIGVVGVAAGATVVPVKPGGTGSGSTSGVIAAECRNPRS
jgi:hypothetical protein